MVPSTGKVVLTIFWNHNGPIYWEFTDSSQARINKDTYFDMLMYLRDAIQ